jgi:hypothetical protein
MYEKSAPTLPKFGIVCRDSAAAEGRSPSGCRRSRGRGRTGTDVMIFKDFRQKNLAKKLAFFTQNKDKLFKKLSITFVY